MIDSYSDATEVPLLGDRPLLIVDADEVLLRFASGFNEFLATRGCFLDAGSYDLLGNVRQREDQGVLSDADTSQLLEEFRAGFDRLEPVTGALDAIAALSPLLEIVVLSNMTPTHVSPRLRNFERLGLRLPLVTNSGLKGPAVKALADRAGRPVFFVDDIPRHLASVAELARDVVRIHLVGDERYKDVRPFSPHAHLSANSWGAAVTFIRDRCGR